jgi:hypothetical protein
MVEEHKPPPYHLQLTSANPSLYPTRLTTFLVNFPGPKGGSASQGFNYLLGGGKEKEKKDKDKERSKDKARKDESVSSSDNLAEEGREGGSQSVTDAPPSPRQEPEGSASNPPSLPSFAPTPFTPGPPGLQGKKKSVSRPKHNIRTTSSSFVTRLQSIEGLSKLLASKQGETTFLFYNCAKSLYWTEVGNKSKDSLARITFSAYPTCHDVNTATSNHLSIDMVIGFSTGDLIWFDPLSSRYHRINKGGCITNSACTAVKWVTTLPTRFLVSHADGTIIMYDKEREDGPFTPRNPTTPAPSISLSAESSTSDPHYINTSADGATNASAEWDPLEDIFVTHGSGQASSANPSKAEKIAKNPVSHWKVSTKSVVDFAFSRDVKTIAVISDDGYLRVIDTETEHLMDVYQSYFGSPTCVAWSPDSRFLLVGGQDDLVTIVAPFEQRIIARCQGHSSFVSAVAFDEIRCDGRTYRFGSTGEDNKLILWDFSSGALHRPKLQGSQHQRLSLSSTVSLGLRKRGEGSTLHLPNGIQGKRSIFHPAPSRNEVAILQPVLIKSLEGGDLLSAVAFVHSNLFTVARTGTVKTWVRPLPSRSRNARGSRARDGVSTA